MTGSDHLLLSKVGFEVTRVYLQQKEAVRFPTVLSLGSTQTAERTVQTALELQTIATVM